MTREDIIEMARQAGAVYSDDHAVSLLDDEIIIFAKLVAAHTLMNIDPSKFMSYHEGFEAGVAKEREALVLFLRNLADDHTPTDCADMICALQSLGAIRARGY